MHLTRVVTVVVAFSIGALAASCASSGSRETGAPKPFHDMSREERFAHMKTVVFPEMKTAFQAAAPHEFAGFTCATCHGDGAVDKTFKMPNPKLPTLPSDDAGFKRLMANDPKMVKFMSGTVVPRMAAMLGEPEYDPKTGKGFGCFECHTKE